MISLAIILLSFLNPSIKLNSGKTLSLSGEGPPLLFSSGLFGTMPMFIYSDFLNKLKNNFTVVKINNNLPLNNNDIEDVVKTLSVENIGYLSHSSFDPRVLETDKINNAVLIDPICLPRVDINGLNSQEIDVNYPVLLLKSGKLYNSTPTIPEWQEPIFKKEVDEIIYDNVGHPDILDNRWADLAKTNGFWDTTNGNVQNYKDWKYNKNSIKKIREEYREFVAEICKEFIL